jgi:hypothetical protein
MDAQLFDVIVPPFLIDRAVRTGVRYRRSRLPTGRGA